jgi:hypothetical protein
MGYKDRCPLEGLPGGAGVVGNTQSAINFFIASSPNFGTSPAILHIANSMGSTYVGPEPYPLTASRSTADAE